MMIKSRAVGGGSIDREEKGAGVDRGPAGDGIPDRQLGVAHRSDVPAFPADGGDDDGEIGCGEIAAQVTDEIRRALAILDGLGCEIAGAVDIGTLRVALAT